MKICLSLYGSTEEVCREIGEGNEADLFEVRLDLSHDLDLPRIRACSGKPLLFASHLKPELLETAASFADFLDVGPHPERGTPTSIVSIHSGETDPLPLWNLYSGVHTTKIVIETQNYSTIAALLELNRHPGALCFAMGEVGAFSRVLSLFAGARWMYCSSENKPTASGQFTLREITEIYRVKRFTKGMEMVFGIVGSPVSHSRSPEFHNASFAEAGLPWIYLPFHCLNLKELFQHAARFHIRGLSITHPHKKACAALVDVPSPEVVRLRACNTVCYKDGRWHGINTDVAGITAMLNQAPVDGKSVVILGAGSSARVIAELIRPVCQRLVFLNRTRERAEQLSSEFRPGAGILTDLRHTPHDVLIQTTPVGLRPGECPVDSGALRPATTVFDAIYNPQETELLRRAKSLGCHTINGEHWFLAQAAAQLQWWKEMLT